MSLRRVNHHQTGFSNIDFRTNQDKAALKLFQPWMVPPDYGTMGHANCSALPDIRRKVMKNSKSLCSLYEFEKGIPNSKTYNTCEFYSRNKIVPKFKTILNNGKRYANLDESKIGKEIYNGDSMMIAENRKKRAEIIRRKKLRKTTSSVFDRMEMSTKEKMKRMFDDTIHLNEEENKKEENKEISSDEIDNSKKTPLEEDNYVDLENIQKIRNVFK
ncbi:MAG: hypothetical protein MJ252_03690, partial [archaeon]|nr:hypothetical protein [archaeon]